MAPSYEPGGVVRFLLLVGRLGPRGVTPDRCTGLGSELQRADPHTQVRTFPILSSYILLSTFFILFSSWPSLPLAFYLITFSFSLYSICIIRILQRNRFNEIYKERYIVFDTDLGTAYRCFAIM